MNDLRKAAEMALRQLINLQPYLGNGLLNKTQLAFIDPAIDEAIKLLNQALAEPSEQNKAIEDALNYGQGFVKVQHVPLDEVIDHNKEPEAEPHWLTKELFAEYLELIYYAINDKEDRHTLFDKAYWMKRKGEV